MYTANAYYNGTNIVVAEKIPMRKGQRLLVTVLEPERPRMTVEQLNAKLRKMDTSDFKETEAGLEAVREALKDDVW